MMKKNCKESPVDEIYNTVHLFSTFLPFDMELFETDISDAVV